MIRYSEKEKNIEFYKRMEEELRETNKKIEKIEKSGKIIEKTILVIIMCVFIHFFAWSISFGYETNLGKSIIFLFAFAGLIGSLYFSKFYFYKQYCKNNCAVIKCKWWKK